MIATQVCTLYLIACVYCDSNPQYLYSCLYLHSHGYAWIYCQHILRGTRHTIAERLMPYLFFVFFSLFFLMQYIPFLSCTELSQDTRNSIAQHFPFSILENGKIFRFGKFKFFFSFFSCLCFFLFFHFLVPFMFLSDMLWIVASHTTIRSLNACYWSRFHIFPSFAQQHALQHTLQHTLQHARRCVKLSTDTLE